MRIYELDLYEQDNIDNLFRIGFFTDCRTAFITADRYLSEVSGFCDKEFAYLINERAVIPDDRPSDKVYVVFGSNGSESDIIQSECYSDRSDAESELSGLSSLHQRSEWFIRDYNINECRYQNGPSKE